MIKKLGIGASVWAAASSALMFGKAGSSNDLVFGNYSDYISADVAEELGKEFGLRVDLFDYDHLVKERFEKGIYDMAIVSTSVLSELKSTNNAMKLDWSKLLDKQDEKKATSEDAKGLFTDIVQKMSKDLLDYGIPYFVQKLSFYYRGREITDWKKPVTFRNLVNRISQEERFVSKDGKPTLGMIDDPRTVLSLSRKVADKKNVNPSESEYSTSGEILKDYRSLIDNGLSKEKLGKNFLFMHSDSGPLVDALSDGTIKGAFMYNGDGYFASEGGNAKREIKADDFHTVELSENIFFLDFLAFSKKMPKHKEEKAYGLAKKLLFISKENEVKPFKTEPEDGGDDAPYAEMAVRNFDDVGYTPTLKSIYDKLGDEYFTDEEEDGKPKDLVKGETKHEIIKVEESKTGNLEHDYEKQFDPTKKSDMLIAYSNFKSLL